MDTEPLLPTHLLDSLPEYSKVSHFSAPPASPASFYKEHIIFGTHPSPLPHGAQLRR
jgi:potassium channel subfamily K